MDGCLEGRKVKSAHSITHSRNVCAVGVLMNTNCHVAIAKICSNDTSRELTLLEFPLDLTLHMTTL